MGDIGSGRNPWVGRSAGWSLAYGACLSGRADVRFAGGELLVTANSIR